MRSYEGLFVFAPESSADARKKELKAVEDLIKKFGGSISDLTEWGKKKLGYQLRKFHEGFYVICRFQLPPENTREVRKSLQLQEEILKFTLTLEDPRIGKMAVEKLQGTAAVAAAASAPAPAAAVTAKPVPSSTPTSHS